MSDLPGGRVRVHWLPLAKGIIMSSTSPLKAACGKSYWPYQLATDPAKVECKLCRKKVQSAS